MEKYYEIVAKNPTRITNTIEIGTVSHAEAVASFLDTVREWLSNDVSGHVIHWADADTEKPNYYAGSGYYDADAERCILLDSDTETTTVDGPGETYSLAEQSHYIIAANLVRKASMMDVFSELDSFHDDHTHAIWVYDTETCELDYRSVTSPRHIELHFMKASKADDGLNWNEDLFTPEEAQVIRDHYNNEYLSYLADHPETESYADRCRNAREHYWAQNWSQLQDSILEQLASESV